MRWQTTLPSRRARHSASVATKNIGGESMPERLRCFIQRERGCWKAYCVDVDLSATGASPDEARAALDLLLDRFCYEGQDATAGNSAARRASFPRRTRYWAARLFGREGAPYTRHCYDYHSPPQLLSGLS